MYVDYVCSNRVWPVMGVDTVCIDLRSIGDLHFARRASETKGYDIFVRRAILYLFRDGSKGTSYSCTISGPTSSES